MFFLLSFYIYDTFWTETIFPNAKPGQVLYHFGVRHSVTLLVMGFYSGVPTLCNCWTKYERKTNSDRSVCGFSQKSFRFCFYRIILSILSGLHPHNFRMCPSGVYLLMDIVDGVFVRLLLHKSQSAVRIR